MKKFFTIILISIFFTNFSQTAFGAEFEDKFPDKTIPEITKIETVYSNKKGEFFIYGENFGKDLSKIEVLVESEFIGKEEAQKIKIENIYSTMLSGEISGEYENGTVVVKKQIGEKEFVYSEKKYFNFGLPTLKKIEAEDGFIGGKKVIFSGENFKKPIYGILGKEKIICEKDSENICEITIPKDENFSGKIGIESYGFEILDNEDISVDKTAKVEVSSYSNNSIYFNVDGFEYKDLVKQLKTKDDFDLFEAKKQMELNSDVEIYLDGQKLEDCEVNSTGKIYCPITRNIYKKGIGYIDFFGIKTSFFSYDLSDSTPYPTNFSKSVKWSTYQDSRTKESIEGNRIYIDIGIANFDYQRSSNNDDNNNGYSFNTKDDLSLFFGGKEYLQSSPELTVSKDKIELVLSAFPSQMKGELYLKFGNIISESLAYDFGEYVPELYKVYKGSEEDIFYLEGKNLTNFNDLEASLRFGESFLNTNDIKKFLSEEEKRINSEIKKYNDRIKSAEDGIEAEENKEFPDNQIITNYENSIIDYKNQVSKYESELRDLQNGIYERSAVDLQEKEGEILRKSDTQIQFKVFDPKEYGKSIGKGEYEVSVTSNGITSNKINFFYDPNSSQNSESAYPLIEKIDFPNGAGDPSQIQIKGQFLDSVKEIYFTDLKGEIVKKDKTEILVKLDPKSILRKRGTIIAKLDDLSMTSNLFFYEFIDDKTNEISLNWKKVEEIKEDEEKIYFELLLKNIYKDVIFKNLKIKIKNLEKEDLPFFNFYLDGNGEKIKGIYDEKKSEINFENKDFSKILEINEEDFYEFNLVFEKIKSGKGEVEILVSELNFYDNYNFPKQISQNFISSTKTPQYYKVEDNFGGFCKELNLNGEYIDCGSEIWSSEDLNSGSSVFEEEVIKSDFRAPSKDKKISGAYFDVDESQWFSPYVKDLSQRGVIGGYSDGSFKPLGKITRAESVKMLLVARNEELENLKFDVFAFEDVPESHWAKNILEYAVRNKFLTPVKNFHLQNEITRGEAAKLITKFFGRIVPEYSKYSLIDLGEHWSSNHAEYLFQNGIISGVGETKEFKANNKVTRSEFAKMISLAIETWSR